MALLEPCLFSKCSLNWEITPLVHKSTKNQSFFFACDTETEHRFVFHITWSQLSFYARNLLGDTLFRGKLNSAWCDSLTVLLPNGEKIENINSAQIQLDDSSFYECTVDANVTYLHGPFSLDGESTAPGERQPDVEYTLCANGLLIKTLEQVKKSHSNIHKVLILSKGLQILLYNRQHCTWIPPEISMPKFSWTPLPSYQTDIMSSLGHLGNCKLLYKRVLKGSTWHHYIDDYTCPDNEPRLVLEYTKDSDHLEVFDACGILQYYALGVACENGTKLYIHNRLFIGEINSGCLVLRTGLLAMRFRQVESEIKIDYAATNSEHSAICTLKSVDDGITVTMNKDIHAEWKALVVTFLFKVARKHLAFWPVSGRRKGDEQTPSLVYSRNPKYKEERVLDLSMLSTKVKLVNAGHDRDQEIAYYKVIDWENDDCVHHCVMFSVTERPERVEAAAYDHSGSLAFSVKGLWGMNTVMVVNTVQVIGLYCQEKIYDKNGELMLLVEDCGVEDRQIIALYYQDVKTNEKNCVAEIYGDCEAIYIQFIGTRHADMEKRALIMSFALRLAYNKYQMYAKPVRTIPFPQNPPTTVL